MATTINADNVTGGAVVTGDASGVLALQAAGNTGLTLNSSRAVGVGASPSFGTSGQVLTSAGSAAAPAWQTPTVTAPAGTTGQVQINNAGAFGAVGSGTTGQVLTSAGAGAAPTWAAAGGMTLLATLTPANGTTSIAATGLPSCKQLLVVCGRIIILSPGDQISFRVSVDNGSNYPGSNPFFTNASTQPEGGVLKVYNSNINATKIYEYSPGSSGVNYQKESSATINSGTVNAIQFLLNAGYGGTFTGTGSIYVYGIN